VLSKSQRSLRARVAAHSLHGQRDSRELTAAARTTFCEKFEDLVDPDGALPQAERQRRVEQLRHAYFARLALKSSRARSQRSRSADETGSNASKDLSPIGRRGESRKDALRPEVRAVFRRLRREQNLTQAQLAARTGGAVCTDAVSDLETGRHASHPATVEAILSVLRISMERVRALADQNLPS